MKQERTLEEVLLAIDNCLATPLVLKEKEERKTKLEKEQNLTCAQERLYAPNAKQLFKQFSL